MVILVLAWEGHQDQDLHVFASLKTHETSTKVLILSWMITDSWIVNGLST